MKKPQHTHPIDAKIARRLAWLEELIDHEYEARPKVIGRSRQVLSASTPKRGGKG